MGSTSTAPVPARPRPWRAGLGAPCRRHRAALTLAALALCGAGGAAAPEVVLDDGLPALGCAAQRRPVHGPALALPAAGLASAQGTWADGTPVAHVFRSTFDMAAASGTLTRMPVLRNGDGSVRLAAPVWDAGALLAAMAPAARRMLTLADDGATIPFDWERLPAARRALLDSRPAPGAGSDGLGAARVAWLRGDRALEGIAFRRRDGVLGDAVHGAPVFVGAAAGRYRDAAYAQFARAARQRPAIVYLGANDGMLHAFDAAMGREWFAYVPAMLTAALPALASPGYAHRAYVDGPLTADEAVIGGRWRSVLLASTGGGARGLFALDVTDPASTDGGPAALWEFSPHDDAAIGHVVQPAQVARLRVRGSDGRSAIRYFAIVGNGVDGDVDAAQGALFLLALDKPANARWRLNSHYYRLDTPPGDVALPAGLGAPALIADDEGVLRHAYAGDLQGNLWRFDFTGGAPWRQARGWQPVFVARDAAGNRQPIAQPPRVAYAEGGGYLVLFGTGSLYSRAERDPAAFLQQSFYALYDDPAGPARPAPLQRADLAERRLEGFTDAAQLTVTGRMATIGAGDRPQGWYLDFADGARTGERSIEPATLAQGQALFATVVPGRDPCADSASRHYALDVLTGLAPGSDGNPALAGVTGTLIPDAVLGQPLLLAGSPVVGGRQPNGRVVVRRDTAAVRFGATGDGPRVAGQGVVAARAGRLSWREIANWRQLHAFATRGRQP